MALLPSVAGAVERGPHPQQVTADSALLVWHGDDGRRLTVTGPGEPRVLVPPKPGPDGRVVVRLDGLAPGTEWRYALATDAGVLDGRFSTPPAPGRPFTFVAYGDSRTDHRVHAALAARIAEVDPDVVLHTGDLVTRGHRDHEWGAFFEASRPIWQRAPLVPVMGNHDLDDGTAAALLRHFALPEDRPYFAFTWGNVRFIGIDTEVHAVDDVPDAAQRAWLFDELKRARREGARHVVGFAHKGPFSSHPARTGNAGLRAMLPELHAAGLDLLISGHDHFYERGEAPSGMPYLVLGAGGAPLYETVGPGRHEGYVAHVSRPIFSFARFRVVGEHLEGCGLDLTGAPFDCFVLKTSPRAR